MLKKYASNLKYTILATKQYDIAHNRLEVDENEHKLYVKPIENNEIGYFDMKGINKSEIFQSYISILQNGSEHALNNSIKGMNSKVTGLIKDECKEDLKEYLKQFKRELEPTDEIIMYIAKLQYPYIIVHEM